MRSRPIFFYLELLMMMMTTMAIPMRTSPAVWRFPRRFGFVDATKTCFHHPLPAEKKRQPTFFFSYSCCWMIRINTQQ
jgi:hypothetical protein